MIFSAVRSSIPLRFIPSVYLHTRLENTSPTGITRGLTPYALRLTQRDTSITLCSISVVAVAA